MATLRELIPGSTFTLGSLVPGSVAPPTGLRGVQGPATAQIEDQAEAAGMGQLRRGFATGRLGGDANALAADESSLRAAGRAQEADELARQRAVVQQRAGVFAPAEQDVTKLNWEPGRILDYGLGAVGQGAASMLDPVVATAGLAAVGRGLSAIPTTRVLGAGLSRAASAVGFALNYRQAKGEFVGDAYRDPETMRTKSAQEIENAAMFSGAVSGGLDSLLTGAVAGRMVGKPGMKALGGMGVIPKTGLDMVGEAGTELAQGEVKRGTLSFLNPNRDTSGDVNDRWNDATGGFFAAAPFSLASNLAQKGHARLDVVDEPGNDVSGKAGKPTGPTTPPLNETLAQSFARGAAARRPPNDNEEAWREMMRGEGDFGGDLGQMVSAQHAGLTKELGGRAAKGDAAAQQHLDALNADDQNDPGWVMNDTARTAAYKHLLGDGTGPESDDRLIAAYAGRKLNQQAPYAGQDRLGGGKVTGGGDDVGGGKMGPPVTDVTRAARAEHDQRLKLTTSILRDSVDDARPKAAQLRGVAAELATELVELGAKGLSKPTRGDVARVGRLGRQVVALYGSRRAEGVLDAAAKASGIEGSALYKGLRGHVILAADQGAYQKAETVERATAADQLLAVVPARTQNILRSAGMDLTTPQGKAELLDRVEGYFDSGHDTAPGGPVSTKFNQMFGKAGVEAMREVLGQRIQGRVQQDFDAAENEALESAKTAAAKDSDDITGEEEGADRERQNAEKNIENAPGARDYTFFGGRGASGAEARHPFVADAKNGNLPGLMRLDSVDKTSGVNSLDNLKEKLFAKLGGLGLKGPKVYRLVKLLEAGQAGPPQPVGDAVGDREGDADSINKGDLAVGGTRIRTTSAKEVMDHHKVSPTERVEVMRNYLARIKGGRTTLPLDDPTIQQLRSTDRKIAALEKTTPKERVLAVGASGALAEDNPAHAALRDLKGMREETAGALAAKIGVEYREGMTLAQMADAYFSDAHLVVAEQMAERDQMRVTRPEFIAWARLGARYLKRTDLAGSEARDEARRAGETLAQIDAAGEAATNKMAADMNLLRFKSSSAVADDGIAVIPANELASWVYENRTDHKEKGYNSIEARAVAHRAAIMEGVAALVADGFADELPYMVNEGGQRESFEQGFPPSLRLGGVAQAELDIKKAQGESKAWGRGLDERTRREALTPRERYQEDQRAERARKTEVAKEQNAKDDEPVRNTDADELVDEGKRAQSVDRVLSDEGEDLVGPRDPLAVTTIKDKAQFWDAPAAESADELAQRTMGNTGEGERSRVPLSPVAPETVDTRTDDPSRTPLDAERKQTSGVPTDRTDLRNRNSTVDAALDKIDDLTPMNAMRKAPDVARSILGVMSQGMEVVNGKLRPLAGAVPADPRSGFQRMQRLVASLRAAQFRSAGDLRPVGGKQYAAPLAHILTPDNIAWMASLAKNPAKAKADLELMRSETADSLTKEGGLSQADKTTLARLLTGNEKLSSMKAAEALEKLAWPARMERKRLKDKADAEAAEAAAKIARKKAGPTETVVPKTEPAVAPGPKAAEPARKLNQMVGTPIRLKDGGRITISTAPAPESFGGLTRMMFGNAVAQIATNEKGEEVGRLIYMPGGGPIDSSVRKQDRRRGIASALYNAFETAGGKLPKESDGFIISDEARAFRAARKLNQQATTPTFSTDAQVAEAKVYVAKVLGPAVKVETGKLMGAMGEWIEADNLIKLSLSAGPGLLSIAHHEALHGLFSRLVKNSPEAAQALTGAMSSPRILARLNDLLAAHPAALAAIKGDTDLAREERVAYAYQFWAAGELVIDKKPATLFDKVRRLLRVVFGMVRESETAHDILAAFHDGKLAEPSAAGKVISAIMAKQTWNEDIKRRWDKQIQGIHTAVDVSNEVMRKSESKTMRELATVFFTGPGRESDGAAQKGYLNARTQVGRQYGNFLYHSVKGLSDKQMEDVAKLMQTKEPLDKIASPTLRKAVSDMRALTKRYYNYATQSVADGGPGLTLEYLGDDHYPRVWDLAQLIARKDEFIAMLLQPKYAKVMNSALAIANKNSKVLFIERDIAVKMLEHLMDKNGVDDKGVETAHGDMILSPFFASQKERSFKWLEDADVEPFLEKDLIGAMTRYLHQGIRAAEFARRFGNGGEYLHNLTKQIGDLNSDGTEVLIDGDVVKELRVAAKEKGVAVGKDTDVWVARRMEDLKNAVAAHEGSLGSDISPVWRKTSSALMAYQNLRLLPLSLFAAFADPMSISARSDRGMAPAMDALTQGLKDVWARWKAAASDMPEERVQSVWEKMAEASGAADSNMFLEQMGKAHTSEFMTDLARKSNRLLFMVNGLTGWDRSMRVTATKYAALFIADHKDLPNKQHSARWLKELGLTPADIVLDADGVLIFDRHVLAAQTGMPIAEATAQIEKIHYAITRWVEGAVLTPNAAQRPIWASDPRWSVLFHLKQFTYSFQDTVLRRAANEAKNGNMAPLGSLVAAVPVMMVSDVLKGFVQGGGSLPAYMKAWGFGDHLMHGIARSGLGGTTQLGIEALRDPVSLFGPTVEQFTKIILNPSDLAVNAVDAVPGLRAVGGVKDLVRVAG